MWDTYSAASEGTYLSRSAFLMNLSPLPITRIRNFPIVCGAAGHLLKFNPEALVYHLHPNSFVKYFRIKVKRGYWRHDRLSELSGKGFQRHLYPRRHQASNNSGGHFAAVCLFLSCFSEIVNVAALLYLGIMASSAAFSIKTFKKDPVVGLISPMVVLGRAIAFALGSLLSVFYRRK